jgi:hypothetical protein
MTRKARLWVGVTLLVVLGINYAMIGMPLLKRKEYIQKRSRAMLLVKNSDDEYMADIFRKERFDVEKKIKIVNSVGISITVLVASWTVFGLVFPGKTKGK